MFSRVPGFRGSSNGGCNDRVYSLDMTCGVIYIEDMMSTMFCRVRIAFYFILYHLLRGVELLQFQCIIKTSLKLECNLLINHMKYRRGAIERRLRGFSLKSKTIKSRSAVYGALLSEVWGAGKMYKIKREESMALAQLQLLISATLQFGNKLKYFTFSIWFKRISPALNQILEGLAIRLDCRISSRSD